MKRCRWILALFVAVTLTAGLAPETRAEKKIGVLVWSEEPRYTDAKNGIVEGLKRDGFGEGAVKFVVENADGNKARAAEFAKQMAGAGYDLVVALGTSAAIPVAKEIKETPVVFAQVYDPVESKIAEKWESSNNNTTGAAAKVDMGLLVANLKKLAAVKRLAVLYTPGEKNSEIQLKELQALSAGAGLKIVPVPVSKKEDVPNVMAQVAGTAEALFLSGSSVVGETVGAIVEGANKARMITVSHLDDTVQKGALLGVVASPYQQGLQAGGKAAKIFKGSKPAELPIDILTKLDIVINQKTAQAAGVSVPAELLSSASRVIR